MEGHVGMKSENLQEYLNWYACLFRVAYSRPKREVTQDCKGTSPSDTHGRALPQPKETLVSAHWLTIQ